MTDGNPKLKYQGLNTAKQYKKTKLILVTEQKSCHLARIFYSNFYCITLEAIYAKTFELFSYIWSFKLVRRQLFHTLAKILESSQKNREMVID